MADNGFITVGRGRHSGLRLPLKVVASTDKIPLPRPCLKIVLFTAGTGPIRIQGRRSVVTAPALLCLNHKEALSSDPHLGWTAALFLPELLNTGTTTSVLECLPSAELASQLDDYWAAAFRPSPSRRARSLPLPPLTFHRFRGNMTRLEHELTSQTCEFWPHWARAYLNEMLFLQAQLSRQAADETVTPADLPEHPAAPIVLALRQRYHERISIDELAREFHSNRTTLQKLFRSYTGRTIGAYLRELRLAMARTLLSGSTAKIDEVAERVGFSDTTHFIRMFRRAYSLTPARYRRNPPAR